MARPSGWRQSRILTTSEGRSTAAFGPLDWALFLLVGIAWGSSFLFIDVALDDLEPGVVTFGRIGLGAAALAVFPADRYRIHRNDWARVLLLGLIWIAIPETLLPVAQRWINSAVTGMLVGAVPILTALVGATLLGRRPGRSQAIGIAAGMTGIVFIGLPNAADGDTALAGVVAVLTAVVLYAFSANLVAPLQQKYGSLAVMRWVLAAGALLTIPFALAGLSRSTWTWPAAGALAVLGLVATGLAFVAYGALIGRAGATRASGVTYLIPVMALTLGVSLRGDEVSPLAYIGCAFIVLATVFLSRQGR